MAQGEWTPHAVVVEDAEMRDTGDPLFRARWQIFVPPAAVAIIYLLAWVYLHMSGRNDHALARLVSIVMAVRVAPRPAPAFLRFVTGRGERLRRGYHSGWPRELPVDMPYELIAGLRVKKGISGLVFGGGTLVMDLTTGEKAAVADLAEPEAARDEIARRIGATAPTAP